MTVIENGKFSITNNFDGLTGEDTQKHNPNLP